MVIRLSFCKRSSIPNFGWQRTWFASLWGYSTTFLAGFLGALYIVMGSVLGILDRAKRQQLSRMDLWLALLCPVFQLYRNRAGGTLGG